MSTTDDGAYPRSTNCATPAVVPTVALFALGAIAGMAAFVALLPRVLNWLEAQR